MKPGYAPKRTVVVPWKVCTGCGEDKCCLDFDVNRLARDGRATMCKTCRQAAETARKRQRIGRVDRSAKLVLESEPSACLKGC